MMDVILLCTLFGIFILFSLIKGIEIGMKLKRDEPITIKNPIKILKDYKEQRKQDELEEKASEENEINLYNIDAYDGTSIGQKEFK